MSLGTRTRFVRGNADRELVTCFDGGASNPRLPTVAQDTLQWVTEQLGRAHRDFLASFAEQVSATMADLGTILFCHGSPRSDEEIVTVLTPEDRAREALADVSAQVVVCGHTHMQFDRTIGAIRVVNAGSVGMPYGAPGAYWPRLGPGVDLRRTPYDLANAAAVIRASGFPLANDFADHNVLAPPPAAEALALFEGHGSERA
jgi:predicted phosphodiesterase